MVVDKLVASDPNDTDFLRTKMVMLNTYTDLYKNYDDVDAARETVNQSVGIARRLLQLDPGTRASDDLSVSLERLGDVLDRQGDAQGALSAYDESLALSEAAAK